MKIRKNNTRRSDNQQQDDAKQERASQEEILNLDELFDVQGGIDDKLQGGCGLGCFTGSTMHSNPGQSSESLDNNE